MNIYEKLFAAIMGSTCVLGVAFWVWFILGVVR